MTPAEEAHLRSLLLNRATTYDSKRRIGKKLLRKLLAALDAARGGREATSRRVVDGRCSFCGTTTRVVDVGVASVCARCAAAACTDLRAYDDELLARVVKKTLAFVLRGKSVDSALGVARVIAACTGRAAVLRRDGSVRMEREHNLRSAPPAPFASFTESV